MQFTRRYMYLVVVIAAYSFLLLAARWAFFTEMWSILESEQSLDGEYKHANDKEYAIPVRSQRHVRENTQMPGTDLNDQELNVETTGAKKMNQNHISWILKRHQLLQTIFTNFMHP